MQGRDYMAFSCRKGKVGYVQLGFVGGPHNLSIGVADGDWGIGWTFIFYWGGRGGKIIGCACVANCDGRTTFYNTTR
jgi:hypothetical protein